MRRGIMRRGRRAILSVVLGVGIGLMFASLAQAALVSAEVSYEPLEAGDEMPDGVSAGWYKYIIDVEWTELGFGLGHWDLLLEPGCAELDHLILFDGLTLDGLSDGVLIDPETGEETSTDNLGWTGYFEREGDASLGITTPVVKFQGPFSPESGEPGESGLGQFWFYSNIIPEAVPDGGGVIAGKADGTDYFGVFTGYQPSSCEIIPEPATMVLLGIGSLVLMMRRRRA